MKQMLADLVARTAVQYAPDGEYFTLASGAKSKFYLDCRRVTLQPHPLRAVVNALIAHLAKYDGFNAIGGPSVGADPIVGGFLYAFGTGSPAQYGYHKTNAMELDGFLVRSAPKAHGVAGPNGPLVVGPLGEKQRIVLVDDVVTSGGSLLKAATTLIGLGHTIVAATCIVDREHNGGEAAEAFDGLGIPFDPLLKLSDLPIKQ